MAKGQSYLKNKLQNSQNGATQGGDQQGRKRASGIDIGSVVSSGLSSAVLTKLMGGKATSAGKSALLAAGTAAIGALAWKTYQDWQNKQSATTSNDTQSGAAFDDLFKQSNGVDHDRLMLQAMIAAAKADGHVDDKERELIKQQAEGLGLSPELQAFIKQELNRPLDPAEIARQVNSPQQAAELFLMSLLVVDEQNFMEKSYLQELARQLNLSPDMVQQLENQANNYH